MWKRLPVVLLRLLVVLSAAGTAATAAASVSAAPPAARAPIPWRTEWNPRLFADAAREHRFVLLDLHAVWCHWCHVMDEETYGDAAVRALISKRFLPVAIDADASPALAARYGDWGWPATIVLAADGTEIVKRRGYIPPRRMASLLQAIIDDPSPGPSVRPPPPLAAVAGAQLDAAQRAALLKTYDEAYDAKYGGWGSGQKFIDAPTMEYTLVRVALDRDATAARRARATLDANLQLIDPVWGGVSQYSATPDWKSPHYEKLLAFQADDLRLYAQAWARWHDPRYLAAARALQRYLTAFLTSPEGAFYASQDADLSPQVPGHDYYAHDAAGRRRLGIPRIDPHEYARENGWAIRALCALHDVTGDAATLAQAVRAADWILANRALEGGGFRHDAHENGPYLEDTLAMGRAFLALYRSTGERPWLAHARAAMDYLAAHFRDHRGGFFAAPAPAGAAGVFRDPVRTAGDNADVARFANLLQRYTADARYRALALDALKFAVTASADSGLHADVLLADREVAEAPVHITVVGGMGDPRARALHAAALDYPAPYLQVDWWDRSEGPLPDAEIRYPQLARAAAFACTGNTCSTPVFEPQALAPTVDAALRP